MNKYSHSLGLSADAGACTAVLVDAALVERIRAERAQHPLLERTAALFSAMGDPTRLRLLEALAVAELCVCDLASLTGVSSSGTSHQLRVLRELGLVSFTRDGNRAVYRLADDHVRTLLAQGFEHAAEERDE
ncbi:MAG: winged helix-turn-helix transcriptional regulator [Coriobacteriia bacterium]|nr:winged helix-turn-helix transcriptional regulator [Coriobacteriia bacterium]